MNMEQQLRVQAWLDGELPEAEARQVEGLVNGDQQAQSLVAELRMTGKALAGNEPEMKLPETREFYWGKIQREIERLDKAAEVASRPVPWMTDWRRWLAPLSGIALVAFFSLLSINVFRQPLGEDGMNYLVEVENLSEHVGSISYKSQSENMFVVYLYNKDQEAEIDPEAEPVDDTVIQ
jgi:negative regulator of sigma E activity